MSTVHAVHVAVCLSLVWALQGCCCSDAERWEQLMLHYDDPITEDQLIPGKVPQT